MKALLSFSLFLSLIVSTHLSSYAAGKIAAGPIQGHTTAETAHFWILVDGAQTIEYQVVNLLTNDSSYQKQFSTDTLLRHKRYHLMTTVLDELMPNGVFQFITKVDGVVAGQQAFRTYDVVDQNDPQEFSFLTGSCAMKTPGVIKWSNGGPHNKIYAQMQQEQSDFMLWLGDNVYYLFGQGKNPKRMYNKRIRKRKTKKLNSFLKSRPQYAIWDDHDFGPDNSRGDFKHADTSLFIHKQFWPNPYFGLAEKGEKAGNFCHFNFIDVDFFLTDNRYTSTPPEAEKPHMLGAEQEAWLKERLLESEAPFKFVAMGSQSLNEYYHKESWLQYAAERQRIFDFIAENNIKNVIFLTGDRHHTELITKVLPNGIRLYDFTCSPLTSYSNKWPVDAENPDRVAGTFFNKHNYGKIRVATNPEGQRYCEISVMDKKGELVWQQVILSENE